MPHSLTHWQRMLSLFLAGLLMALAYAPVGWGALAVILVAYLFYQWQGASPRLSWWYGWAFGTGLFLSGVYWVFISMHQFGAVPVVFSAFLTCLFALFLGVFPALVGWLAARYFKYTQALRLWLVLPAVWVMLEWIRSWLFTGFPWLNLGISQVDWPLVGYAPLMGEYGISYLLALSAAALVYLLRATNRMRVVSIVMVGTVWGTGQLLRAHSWTTPLGEPLKVALVQGDIEQATKWNPDYRSQIMTHYLQLSRPHWDVDVLVWPETAISAFYDHVPEVVDALEKLARDSNTDVLTGIVYRDTDTGDYFNSIMSLGSQRAFYHKRHLVPFGEFIPLQSLISDVLDFMGLPMTGFSRGSQTQAPLSAGGFLAGMTVCYEIIFNSEVIRSLPQAHYLVNVSNNTWFGNSSMPFQQLQMARLRALETERYVLSATNNGVSAVVDHRGRILARSPQFQAHVLRSEIQAREGATPFVRFGNIPVLILLVVILLLSAWRSRPSV